MADLASLQERIKYAVAEKVIDKVLSREARRHFKSGYKTDCECEVCFYRRNYVREQEGPNHWYRTPIFGMDVDPRQERKELNRQFRAKLLARFEQGNFT